MKPTYVIDKEILDDIVKSITEYLEDHQTDLAYLIDSGPYGISLIFNTDSVRYSLLEGLYSVLKDHGYSKKGNKNKQFDIRKKDKEHRILITYQITEQINNKFVEFLFIPQVSSKEAS